MSTNRRGLTMARETRPFQSLVGRGVEALWPRTSPWPRLTATCWSVAGIVLATKAAASATTLGLLGDHWLVVDWLRSRSLGVVFSEAERTIPYLPHGWLILYPLSLLSDTVAVVAVPAGYAVILAAAGWWLARWSADLCGIRLNRWQLAGLAGIFLASTPAETSILYGQSTPIAVLALAMALCAVPRHRWRAGLWLALATYKPNIVAASLLTLMVSGTWIPLAVASGAVLGMTAIVASVMGQSVMALFAGYARLIYLTYAYHSGGNDAVGIRTWLHAVLPDVFQAGIAWAMVASACIVVTVWAVRDGRPRAHLHPAEVIALWMVCLVLLPNGNYNLVLLMPVLWMMTWPEADLGLSPGLARGISVFGIVVLVGRLPSSVDALIPVDTATLWWEALVRVVAYTFLAVSLRRVWHLRVLRRHP